MSDKPDQTVTMRVRIGDSELEVTGPIEFVEAKIDAFVKSTPKVDAPKHGTAASRQGATAIVGDSGKPISPNQFFRKAAQRSDVSRVLLAAYFLEKMQNAETLTAGDVRDLIQKAKIPPPKNVNDSINQNIRKGYMMSAGNKDNRMAFVLTSDGEEAVATMIGSSGA